MIGTFTNSSFMINELTCEYSQPPISRGNTITHRPHIANERSLSWSSQYHNLYCLQMKPNFTIMSSIKYSDGGCHDKVNFGYIIEALISLWLYNEYLDLVRDKIRSDQKYLTRSNNIFLESCWDWITNSLCWVEICKKHHCWLITLQELLAYFEFSC